MTFDLRPEPREEASRKTGQRGLHAEGTGPGTGRPDVCKGQKEVQGSWSMSEKRQLGGLGSGQSMWDVRPSGHC